MLSRTSAVALKPGFNLAPLDLVNRARLFNGHRQARRRKGKRIELAGRTTKNKRLRFLPIYGDMEAELDMAISIGNESCPFLIRRDGKRVKDFEKAWATACKAAGVEGTLFHNLRRTALSNMIEAGLSEKEAMDISGHRTRAVFDRYHIFNERRLREMAGKLLKMATESS